MSNLRIYEIFEYASVDGVISLIFNEITQEIVNRGLDCQVAYDSVNSEKNNIVIVEWGSEPKVTIVVSENWVDVIYVTNSGIRKDTLSSNSRLALDAFVDMVLQNL